MPTGLLRAWASAGLAVRLVLAAVGTVLLQFHPVRVVTPVLARDVVAVLALLAGQGDLGPHIGGSHEGVPFSCDGPGSTVGPGFQEVALLGRCRVRRSPTCTRAGGSRGSPPGLTLRAMAQPRMRQAASAARSGGRT